MKSAQQSDLDRLKKYAQGLGIRVVFKQGKKEDPAADWTTDGSEITIYTRSNYSKTDLILAFLHELGHHKDHIARGRKQNDMLNDALAAEAMRQDHVHPPIDKSMRDLIYEDEVNGSRYRHEIAEELNLNVAKWKIDADIELDLFVYDYYRTHGNAPKLKMSRQKRKEVRKKWKPKKQSRS